MTQLPNQRIYDLEERTYRFAASVRSFLRKLPKTISIIEDGKQLLRSSGSVGANYIEANESLSKKDFLMRIKICRKEAKESAYWLKLIEVDGLMKNDKGFLQNEAVELTKIFGAIVEKTKI